MTDDAQVGHRGGADLVTVCHRLHAEVHRQPLHLVADVGERGDELVHVGMSAILLDELGDHLAERAQLRAVVHQYLAADQVERLDRVRALVDHVDAGVAHELLHTIFADVAMAAEDLQALRRAQEAVVGHERLHDRRHQRHHVGAELALFVVGV